MSREMSGTSERISTMPAAAASVAGDSCGATLCGFGAGPAAQALNARTSPISRTALALGAVADPRERQVFVVVAEIRIGIDLRQCQGDGAVGRGLEVEPSLGIDL